MQTLSSLHTGFDKEIIREMGSLGILGATIQGWRLVFVPVLCLIREKGVNHFLLCIIPRTPGGCTPESL